MKGDPIIKSLDGDHIGLGHQVGRNGVTKIEEFDHCLLNQLPFYDIWIGEELKHRIVGFPVIITYFTKEELEKKEENKSCCSCDFYNTVAFSPDCGAILYFKDKCNNFDKWKSRR